MIGDSFDWLRQQGVLAIARLLGLGTGKNGPRGLWISPCPICRTERRHPSSKDRRGAIGVHPDDTSWCCFECEGKGGAVELVAAALTGRTRPHDWGPVSRWVKDNRGRAVDSGQRKTGSSASPAPNPVYPPQGEVQALWEASSALTMCSTHWTQAAVQYVSKRGLDIAAVEQAGGVVGLARVLPTPESYGYQCWWPCHWSKTYRVATPLYDSTGSVRSITGRAITATQRKSMFPQAYSCSGLVMASENGVTFLRNWHIADGLTGLRAVCIVEGITDTWKAAEFFQAQLRDVAVLGYISGADALFQIIGRRWPQYVEVWVGTDNDKVGDEYALKLRQALPAAKMKRIAIGRPS